MDRLGTRVMVANRNRIALRAVDLEGLLPVDHRAWVVGADVERLDLSPLYAPFRAVEGHAGRPGVDPAILPALWLYATLATFMDRLRTTSAATPRSRRRATARSRGNRSGGRSTMSTWNAPSLVAVCCAPFVGHKRFDGAGRDVGAPHPGLRPPLSARGEGPGEGFCRRLRSL